MEGYRKRIDALDRRIAGLLARRFRLVRKVGRMKREAGRPVSDPAREKAILDRIARRLEGGEASSYVEEIYRAVFRASRRVQKNSEPGREDG